MNRLPSFDKRECDECESPAIVTRHHVWAGHYFACAEHDAGHINTDKAAAWHALMLSFPWGDDEPISGADVVDRVNELRERLER